MICLMILKIMHLIESLQGIHKAGNYAIRIMNWLVRDIYIYIIIYNYYDLIGTALTYMKGEKLYVSKELFALINDR